MSDAALDAAATAPEQPRGRIELRLHTVAQLFNTFDPSPFREGDLASQAEEYIEGRARELPTGAPIDIVLYLPADEAETPGAAEVGPAISAHFAKRARAKHGEIRELFRSGRQALAIGIGVLGASLLISWYLETVGLVGPISRTVPESIKILGWVSLWRPAEVFFHDWVPISRRRALFERLAAAGTVVKPALTSR